MFNKVEDVQCSGGCSVLWVYSLLCRMISTVEYVSVVEDIEYIEGCSVHWRMFRTVVDVQYCGECPMEDV